MNQRAPSITLILLGFLLAAGCHAEELTETRTSRLFEAVWLRLDGEWQHPPADENMPDYRTAPATLIRFTESHQFSMMSCWITDDGRTVDISNGDGHKIHIGTWNSIDQGIEARFRLVFETLRPIGGAEYPGPEQRVVANVHDDSLEFAGKRFERVARLDFARYEQYVGPEGSKFKMGERNGPER